MNAAYLFYRSTLNTKSIMKHESTSLPSCGGALKPAWADVPALLKFLLLGAGALLWFGTREASAQLPSPNPPALMSYQGYLADANGVPLATNAPKNYDVIFRIYTASQGGNDLWSEQQTVTVDKGYFSVLLGEGSQYNSEPHPNLTDLFSASDASDRYVEITVKGIGSGGSDVTILPRLRLLTSPYSFLAQKAVAAVTLINGSNAPIVSATGTSLNVNGDITLTSGNIFMDNAYGLFAKNASGIYEQWIWPRGSDNATYLNFGKAGFHIRNDASTEVMYLGDNGYVGIGTTSPAMPLHVSNNSYNSPTALIESPAPLGTWLDIHNSSPGGLHWDIISSGAANTEGGGQLIFRAGPSLNNLTSPEMILTQNGHLGLGFNGGTSGPTLAQLEIRNYAISNSLNGYGYLNKQGAGSTSYSGIVPFSIYADGRIAATEVDAFSDARLKKIIGPSDSRRDLKTLMNIQITDYQMVDQVAEGDRQYKKVIAQQVEKVFPQAVSCSTNIVPDIFAKSEARNGWISLSKPLRPALQIGDQVRVITENGGSLYRVTDVQADAFRVQEPLNGPVFVYGRQVGDFRTVDYDAIAMLNVSATQELYRELQSKDEELRRLRQEVEALMAREQAQAARFEKLEALVKYLNPVTQTANAH
jgi:hypothetical protein